MNDDNRFPKLDSKRVKKAVSKVAAGIQANEPKTTAQSVIYYRAQFKANRNARNAMCYLKAAQRDGDHALLSQAAADVCDYLAGLCS